MLTNINKEYVTKFLIHLGIDATLLQKPLNMQILILGLIRYQILKCKNFALKNKLIKELDKKIVPHKLCKECKKLIKNKKEVYKMTINFNNRSKWRKYYIVTTKGKNFIKKHPLNCWIDKKNFKRPKINFEYFKLNKTPKSLSLTMSSLAKHLLENEPINKNSVEMIIKNDILDNHISCKSIKNKIKNMVFSNEITNISYIYNTFLAPPYGITNSLISTLLLNFLSKNIKNIKIYNDKNIPVTLTKELFDQITKKPSNFKVKQIGIT